jgi:hypothetical protein
MDWAKFNDWLRVAGFTGVIASLMFVGLEMQQSRQIAIADIYQQRTAILIDVHSIRLSSEILHNSGNRFFAGEELTDWDQALLRGSWNPLMAYWENNHFQYQLGLMPEEQWIASRNAMRGRANNPNFLEWWEVERSSWRRSFAQAVDEVIEEERAKQ